MYEHDTELEAKLRDIKVGDSVMVRRETINADDCRCPSEVESVKKIRELIPVQGKEDSRVVVVWGTGNNLRVHNMSLRDGTMFGGLMGRRTRYRALDVVSA